MMHLVLMDTTMDKIITSFSWMLMHSLWQGLLLAIFTGTVLMLTKRSTARYRYNLALILFLAFAAICTFTFAWEWNSVASQTIVPPLTGNIGVNLSALFSGNVHDVKELIRTFTGYFSSNAPLIVLIWLIFFLFKSVKMIACLVYNQRIRTRQVCEPGEFWTNAVTRLSEKLRIKKTVRLFQSCYIKMPVVIGHLKPVILMPVGLLVGLPSDQVEAILLHELAHIRRSDYLINFLQNIAETIFFFNPGLLWVSSLLREERENCCDDIALAQTQNKKGFVQALISFREHQLYGPNYATTFAGKKNYLVRRVSRILDYKIKTLGIGEKIFFTMSILILCVIITVATLGQIKESIETGLPKVNHISAHTVLANPAVTNKTEIRKVKPVIKDMNITVKQKMTDDMSRVKEKKELAAAINKVIRTATDTVLINNLQEALKDKQKADRHQIQAVNDEKEAMLAQQKALKDQERALSNQARAQLYQVKAKKDQERAMKEKADTDAAKMRLK